MRPEVRTLLRACRTALITARYRAPRRNYCYLLPGIATTESVEIEGTTIDLADVVCPQPPRTLERRLELLDQAVPMLDDIGRRRPIAEFARITGKEMAWFLRTGRSAEARYAMLLWALGRAQGVQVERTASSLILIDGGERYGVANGHIVGGDMDGLPLDIDLDAVLTETTRKMPRSRDVVECHESLRSNYALSRAFLALYARSLWDQDMFWPSLIITRNGDKTPDRQDLEDEAFSSGMPYMTLMALMTPHFLTRADFVKTFAQSRRALVGGSDRVLTKITNGLYSIPFFPD